MNSHVVNRKFKTIFEAVEWVDRAVVTVGKVSVVEQPVNLDESVGSGHGGYE